MFLPGLRAIRLQERMEAEVKLRHIINTLVWWVAGALFTFGMIALSPAVANDPAFDWLARLALFAILLVFWPAVLGSLVSGAIGA